ncbi:MAG: energy-coupled thiamine transporter ThiT, partial [Clostridia bacterium]|nr:energy-coupled thiamine transporter ThiT [Clostridia bacterium]
RILAISTGGAALALSFVLSRITMFRMPMGGSVTPASMLPLLLFAMAFGPGFGYGACAIMAVLQLIGGYLLFPLQVVLDYLLPFTIFGSVGFLHSNTQGSGTHGSGSRNFLSRIRSVRYVRAAVCTSLCYAAQLLCSTLSGVIFYSEYAGDMNVWAYSLSYNALFIAPECIITLLAMSAVFALARKSE